MATDSLDRAMNEAEQLSTDELLRLIGLLLAKVRTRQSDDTDVPDWDEVRGMIETPDGFDAQAWVSALRAESDRDHGHA